MEKLEALLSQWQEQEPRDVTLGKLKTDPAYQPRDVRIASFADRGRLEAEAEKHVARLADTLGNTELDPVLAARIEGTLYVVDGHHRLKAHKRAGRRTIRACILDMDAATAVMASKLVNCNGAKLPLHAEQARECAWQWMAFVTAGGTRPLPQGASDRSIGRTYGTGKDTVGTMRRCLPNVNPADYSPDACDPGTGFPRWKHVKGNAMRDQYDEVPFDERQRAQAERMAAKLAAMIAKDRDVFMHAVSMLDDEAAATALADYAEAVADPDAL